MFQAAEIIVISDLHLAPEKGKGLFQADDELTGFLSWVFTEVPCHFVIAGDLFDFLVPMEGEEKVVAFSPSTASERAAAILEHHPEVFDALARLACSPRHEFFVQGGNHDPELALPNVRETIERRLRSGTGTPRVRWMVHGEAVPFTVGDMRVFVEHGDLFDDWNRVNRGHLQTAVSRITRGFLDDHGFKVPPGSQLVVDYFEPLRQKYPWMDWLKPEREAVMPILHEILPMPEKARFLRALAPLLGYTGNVLDTILHRPGNGHRLVRNAPDRFSQRALLRDWMTKEENNLRRGVLRNGDKEQLLSRLREVSAEDRYFDFESYDATANDVGIMLKRGTDLIVHGHTHSAKAYRVGHGLYMNSGTWGRLLKLPASEDTLETWGEFLDSLRDGTVSGFSRSTFIRISRESDQVSRAALMQWNEGAHLALKHWSFNNLDREWNMEK